MGAKQADMYYMRDNHTFRRLSREADAAIKEISEELDAGWTSGMLCSTRPGFINIHANYRRPKEEFLSDCHAAIVTEASNREGTPAA